ncbi:MAG: type II secretion system major pseudopilin GspG [Planctomycetota bacterium]|nr:type II secretion system major pseudopilin GspG [Planctomycetota bacterium]
MTIRRNNHRSLRSRGFRGSRGFTLIEVLLVLVILGMLATVAIVALSGTRETARIDATKLKINQLESALDLYNLALGSYPSDEQGLKALQTKPTFDDEKQGEKWRGPYLKSDPRDEWNHEFKYQKVEGSTEETGGKPFKLWSMGPDGQDGTEDDIKNWTDPNTK